MALASPRPVARRYSPVGRRKFPDGALKKASVRLDRPRLIAQAHQMHWIIAAYDCIPRLPRGLEGVIHIYGDVLVGIGVNNRRPDAAQNKVVRSVPRQELIVAGQRNQGYGGSNLSRDGGIAGQVGGDIGAEPIRVTHARRRKQHRPAGAFECVGFNDNVLDECRRMNNRVGVRVRGKHHGPGHDEDGSMQERTEFHFVPPAALRRAKRMSIAKPQADQRQHRWFGRSGDRRQRRSVIRLRRNCWCPQELYWARRGRRYCRTRSRSV